MRIFVQVLNGADAGRRISLRPGTIVRFGRTAWADHFFPADATLGEIHFEVHTDANGAVVVRNLNEGSGTLVDGAPITECFVRSGQEIQAGQTRFSLIAFSASPEGLAVGDSTVAEPTAGTLESGDATAKICERFQLEEPARPLLEAALSPDAFLKLLMSKSYFRDAVRFQSFRLPKREAVWWAFRCVGERLGESASKEHSRALATAREWVIEPTDERARSAGEAAEALSYGPAAAWVAAAAFWSGNNIAPPVTEAVAPADHLTGTAVTASILIASTADKPVKTAEWLKRFIGLSEEVRLHRERWPTKS